MGDLSEAQRVLLHDLLRASTSTQGYHKATGAIRADQIVFEQQGGNNPVYGSSYYYTSLFGAPEDANWAWMLTGHHMTVQFTIAGDRTAFTPMFTGTQPLQIPTGLMAGWQVLPQQRLLWLLVQEFVGNADFDAAKTQLALVQQGWADTHFSWIGPPPDPSVSYYFRVHGPRILIEYDVQAPLTNQGGHVHAITRDPVNDYRMDWLARHYQEPLPLFRGTPVGTDGLPSMPPGGGGPGGAGGPGGSPPDGRPTP